jgi:hypothetical protein
MKHGNGTFTWESGNQYKGSYQMDMRQGYGEMVWNDGSSYIGEWVKGEQDGYGALTLPDGKVREGYWVKNKLTKVSNRSPHMQEGINTINEADEDEVGQVQTPD